MVRWHFATNLMKIGSETGKGKKVIQILKICHEYKKLNGHLETEPN